MGRKPILYVHAEHNPDDVVTFYEIPKALAQAIRPDDDPRPFATALADLLTEAGAIK